MLIKTVPARTGLQWLKLGFQVVWRQPLAWCLLLLLFIACSMLTPLVPLLGPALELASDPLLGLLMIVAAAQVHTGHGLRPAGLLAALCRERERFHALLALCALHAIAALCLLALQALIDGDDVAGVVLGLDPMNRDLASFLQFESPIQLSTTWVVLALTPFFLFAPALVHWHGIAPRKALWLSAAACLRNWRALLVFVLSWCAVCLAISLVLHLLCLVFAGQQGTSSPLFQVLTFIATWVLALPGAASLVFAFRDCFAAPNAAEAAPASTGLNAA